MLDELKPMIGDSPIWGWEDLKPLWQERLAQVNAPENVPKCIVSPSTVEELARIITYAHRNRWSVLPCGSGSKLGWGGVAKPIDLVVSTERLNRIIEHAAGDLTVTVEAGVKFADLQATLLKTGQFLPLDPAYPQAATVGGLVATADSGSLRQRYGGVRDLLLGLSFVRADGQLAKAGGRVVKNVAGYDLMKLFTGSYGTLGIITQVTLRVYPIAQASGTVVLTGEADAIASATQTLLASALTPTAADLLSPQLVSQLGLGQGMGLVVRFQSVEESVREQSSRLLDVGQTLKLNRRLYRDPDEAELWHALPEKIWAVSQPPAITGKIGVRPTAVIATLMQLETLTSQSGLGLIHSGSGLGRIRLDPATVSPQLLLKLRHRCESQSGFLTVLEAPIALKQQLDVWGYSGNALDVMRQIKHQFDPNNLFSPHRFVGGI